MNKTLTEAAFKLTVNCLFTYFKRNRFHDIVAYVNIKWLHTCNGHYASLPDFLIWYEFKVDMRNESVTYSFLV